MKKTSLIATFIFLCIKSFCRTTTYQPFPDSNAVWNYRFQLNCFANGQADESYSIEIIGDTIINATKYRKLNIPYVQSQSFGTCGGYTSGYKGAVRHDSTAKKVYIVPPSSSTEQLLYDFTLQVGDTVRGYLENKIDTLDVVRSIDSILVGNTFRKRWEINSCYNIYYIEGIGSTYGLIESSPGCVTDFADFSLTCFQQEGQSLLPDTNTACLLINSLPGSKNPKLTLSVYPNPFSHQTTIRTNGNLKNATLTIKNYEGQTVLLLENISGNGFVFNKGDLSNGIYLASLSQNDKAMGVLKLVIIDD